jgi:hypothetical protein
MDHETFDAVTRNVAEHTKRRTVLRLATLSLAAIAGHAIFGADEADARKRRRKRKKRRNRDGGSNPDECEQTVCDGQCVDLATDQENCGQCGKACANGLTCCDGICRALETDNSNCGACGNECFLSGSRFCICGICVFCPLGASAPAGSCTCDCPQGQTDCDGVCRDTC